MRYWIWKDGIFKGGMFLGSDNAAKLRKNGYELKPISGGTEWLK